jgi:hypothetical protein
MVANQAAGGRDVPTEGAGMPAVVYPFRGQQATAPEGGAGEGGEGFEGGAGGAGSGMVYEPEQGAVYRATISVLQWAGILEATNRAAAVLNAELVASGGMQERRGERWSHDMEGECEAGRRSVEEEWAEKREAERDEWEREG